MFVRCFHSVSNNDNDQRVSKCTPCERIVFIKALWIGVWENSSFPTQWNLLWKLKWLQRGRVCVCVCVCVCMSVCVLTSWPKSNPSSCWRVSGLQSRFIQTQCFCACVCVCVCVCVCLDVSVRERERERERPLTKHVCCVIPDERLTSGRLCQQRLFVYLCVGVRSPPSLCSQNDSLSLMSLWSET